MEEENENENLFDYDYNHFMKCLMAASWMSKMYPMEAEEDKVPSLESLCIKNLTDSQKTFLVARYSEQLPFITKNIIKETKMDYDRVVFDIQWMRSAIPQNTVSSLKERLPMMFKTGDVPSPEPPRTF